MIFLQADKYFTVDFVLRKKLPSEGWQIGRAVSRLQKAVLA